MPHDITLISTIAVGFALAFLFGFIANRLGSSPLVGYLVAGVAVGPFTPGFVADRAIAGQLAEIGVMLLMFGVGLHFSVADLMAVRRVVIPGAIGQIVIATSIGIGIAMAWGWSVGAGVVLGLSLSVASTVVLLKALEERNVITTVNGRIAIGWLIVEDLAMVLVLVLLPAFAEALGGQVVADAHAAGGQGLFVTLGLTLAKVAAFVAVALLVGPRVLPWLLRQVARTGSRELFTLCVLTVAIGIAFGSATLFSVSFALGAFFAGMVLSESELSHKAAANSLPLQDAFAVLFFVSVGMLFDPSIVWREPLMVLAVLLLILVGKSLVAMGIVLLMGYPLSTALFASASLAQIGEFSFILAGLGATYSLLPLEGINMILAGALLSTTLNPLVFRLVDGVMGFVQRAATAGAALRGAAWRALRRRARRLGSGPRTGRAESRRPQDLHAAGARRSLPALRRLDARATRGAAPALQTADGGARGTHLPRRRRSRRRLFHLERRGRGLGRRTADQAGGGRGLRRDGADQRPATLGRCHCAGLQRVCGAQRARLPPAAAQRPARSADVTALD